MNNKNMNVNVKKPAQAGKKKKNRAKKPNGGGGQGFSLVQAPAVMSISSRTMEPKITRGAKSFRIAHRELVAASVAGSTTFTVQNFLKLNPGLAATFPWLAPQAAQWEQYRCNKLLACWVPIAPTSTQGDIILSPNYDASDPQPTTETQASNNYGAIINPCWQPACLQFDLSGMMGLGPRRFVRTCAVAGDVKTFDIGTLAVCSNNETGTTVIGKLFLEYDFEFFIPQNDPSPATSSLYTSFLTRAAAQTIPTGVVTAIDYDTTVFDPLGLGTDAAGVFTPPAGAYLIRANASCNDSGSEAFSASIELYKNGATMTPRVLSTFNIPAPISSAQKFNLDIIGVIACNGTDTFAVYATLVGAAGTLTVIANSAQLVVSLA